ncbi:MAG: FAD-dependent oxidoreductase, partial [Verrucomicrobiales bacterium]
TLARPGDAWARNHRQSTAEFLRQRGFSTEAVDSLLRPFFGGVFLDNDLETSAGLFHYYLRSFLIGRAFVPSGGIQRLATALRRDIPDGHFRFNTSVWQIEQGADGLRLPLDSGEILSASRVIVATDPACAARLLGWPVPETRSTSTLYFRSKRALYPDRCLVLPRAVRPLVRHFVQITNIDPCLAPGGRHLLSATVLDDQGYDNETLLGAGLQEINQVIHGAAALLEPMHVVRVPSALPVQSPQNLAAWSQRRGNLAPGVFLAGDLAGNASQQNALESGVDCADSARIFRRGQG